MLTLRFKKAVWDKKVFWALACAWLLSVLPVAVLIRGQFMHYYGMGMLFLLLLMAYLLCGLMRAWRRGTLLVALFFAALICHQFRVSYLPLRQYRGNDLYLLETPPSWASGIGMMEALAKISKLPPGNMLLDPQWGMPATAIQVFGKYYPQLQYGDISNWLLVSPDVFLAAAKGNVRHLYFIFDLNDSGARAWASQIGTSEKLCGKRKVILKKYRNRTFDHTGSAICRAF